MKKNPFLLVAFSAITMLVACSAKDKTEVKTAPNKTYRTPAVSAPAMRNPNMSLSSDISGAKGVSFSQVKTNAPYIAMTYDDGPHPRNTPRLLDMLRKRNIKATFYVVGKNVNLYPQIVRRIVSEGHEIGSHSWSHSNFAKLSDSETEAAEMQCWLDFSLRAKYMAQSMYKDFDRRYERVISKLIKMIDDADSWCR